MKGWVTIKNLRQMIMGWYKSVVAVGGFKMVVTIMVIRVKVAKVRAT